jgi:hypothetical protein
MECRSKKEWLLLKWPNPITLQLHGSIELFRKPYYAKAQLKTESNEQILILNEWKGDRSLMEIYFHRITIDNL